jgi:hypothetical protein
MSDITQFYNRVAQQIADTVAALPAAATFTSGQFSTSNSGKIVGTIFADQPGNLFIDQSPDGTNYDTITTIATTASNTGANSSFNVDVVGMYARLRWTNTGAGPTSVKRIYAFLRTI